MLFQLPRPYPAITATGQIDMGHVLRLAHQMAREDMRDQTAIHAAHAAKGTAPLKAWRGYRVFFAKRLRELLVDARKQKRHHAEGLRLVSRDITFGGFREIVTTIEAI